MEEDKGPPSAMHSVHSLDDVVLNLFYIEAPSAKSEKDLKVTTATCIIERLQLDAGSFSRKAALIALTKHNHTQ